MIARNYLAAAISSDEYRKKSWRAQYTEQVSLMHQLGRSLAKERAVKRHIITDRVSLLELRRWWDKASQTYPDNRLADAVGCNWDELVKVLDPALSAAIYRDSEKFDTPDKDDGTAWIDVPWASANFWRDSPYAHVHSLHMSVKDNGKVAYAENEAKLVAGVYTALSAGRYLQRFFPDLGEEAIKEWAERCNAHIAPADLSFISSTDKEGWVRIYEKGPDSCMMGEGCVHVYAHDKSVLRLAYLHRGDEILGRAIVREDKMEYVRVYPNPDSTENTRYQTQLRVKLEEAGYTHGSLEGCLLDVEENDDGYTMPYLDYGAGSAQSVEFVQNACYFRVCTCGGYPATRTDGTVQTEERITCDSCGDSYCEEDITRVYSEAHICSGCLESYVEVVVSRRGTMDWVPRDDAVLCSSDDTWYSERVLAEYDIELCVETDEYYKQEDMHCTSRGWVQKAYCLVLDKPDSEDNEYAHRDDTVETHDGRTIHEDSARTATVVVGDATHALVYHKDDSTLSVEISL